MFAVLGVLEELLTFDCRLVCLAESFLFLDFGAAEGSGGYDNAQKKAVGIHRGRGETCEFFA